MLRKAWRENQEPDLDAQQKFFKEAIALRLEKLRQAEDGESADKSDDDLLVKLLADLQDTQDNEAEHLMKDLSEKVRKGLCCIYFFVFWFVGSKYLFILRTSFPVTYFR